MNYLRKKRVYALALLVVIVLLFYTSDWVGRIIYPIHYQEQIQQYAETYAVDPMMVAAIIRVESNFKPQKTSVKNARGLMQIIPSTANWLIELKQLQSIDEEALLQEDMNIQIGTLYLSVLEQQFQAQLQNVSKDDEVALLAAAYNAGPGNVSVWLKEGIWNGKSDQVSEIPFGETRHYVRRIMYYYYKYKDFYEDHFK